MCYRIFIYQIAGDMPAEIQLLSRFVNVFLNCNDNNNNNVLKMNI